MSLKMNNDFNFEKEEQKNDFLKTRVELLGLSERTKNALIKASIRTIGGIVRKSQSLPTDVPGLGSKGVEEIKLKLEGFFGIFVLSNKEKDEKLSHNLRLMTSAEEIQQFLKESVKTLDLSARIIRVLENANILTVGDLSGKTASTLLQIDGLGETGLQEIKATLNSIFNSPTNQSIERTNSISIDGSLLNQNKPSELISDLIGKNISDFISKFSQYFNIQKTDIEGKSRKQEIVYIRNLIVYLLRDYGEMPFTEIGKLLGNRDHTTIIHSYNKAKNSIGSSEDFKTRFAIFIEEVGSINKMNITKERPLIPEIIKSISLSIPTEQKTPPETKEISERNMKVYELYKEGLTLENIAKIIGVTRERVRQIADITIKKIAFNDSILRDITIDPEVLIDEQKKNRKIIQRQVAGLPPKIKKEKRWSRYYLACRSCGTSAIPHVRKGLCEHCVGSFRLNRREEIIKNHDNKCDSCGRLRQEAITLYGRDLYISKNGGVLCRGCFLKKTGKKLGSYKNYEWSRHHECCVKCGTTSVLHKKDGLCSSCSNFHTKEEREGIIIQHGNRCDGCKLDRVEAKKNYSRDFCLTKDNKVLCRKCFQKYARNTLKNNNGKLF